MVKVGDRVKLVKEGGFWFPGNFGKSGTITKVSESEGVAYVEFDDHKDVFSGMDYGKIDRLELISATPTYTIPAGTETVTLKYADGSTQDIDVKNRARGVPDWLKDGAWVVHKENGELHQLIEGEPGYFKAVNKKTWHPFVLDFHPSMTVSDVFRPFTNSDWKWGMWAEYRGEKVFVCENSVLGVYASKKTDPYCFIAYDGLTPTTAP